MINEPIEIFMKFDFETSMREEFFSKALKYMDFILPILIKGNHTDSNEIECISSQYNHIFFLPTNDENTHFVVLRNEQHKDLIFLNTKDENTHTLSVFMGQKIDYKSKESKGKMVFKSIDDLNSFIKEYGESIQKNELTTSEILKNHRLAPYVFRITKYSFDEKESMLIDAGQRYSFNEQLKVFDEFNGILSGIYSHVNKKFPKEFIQDMKDVSSLMEKLKKVLPPNKYNE